MAQIVVTTLISMAVSYAAYWIAAQIAGKSKLKMPDASNYPVQTSMKGIPKQKIYGTTRTAGEVIWLGELHPYTVESDTGGKGGGQSATMEETRYRRSFMISLGEGPMSVTRIWANDKLIWPYNEEAMVNWDYIKMLRIDTDPNYLTSVDVTIFEGIDNSGVTDLTGEYGDYKNDCLLFFNEYELGGGTALPNIVAEVGSGAMSYYIGMSYSTGSDKKIIYKMRENNTVDTTWADSGAWHYLPPDPHNGSTTVCFDLHQMSDGRLLVAHDCFWIEGTGIADGGKMVSCTMLTVDGEIDTSWGYNGHYIIRQSGADYPFVNPRKFMLCNNGDFILLASCNSGAQYSIHRFDQNGTMVYARYYSEGVGDARHSIMNDGVWYDSSKTRLMVVGDYQTGPGGSRYNCMAIDPETGDADTDWPGNISDPGYAVVVASGYALDAYNIERLSDGSFAIAFWSANDNDASLAKITSDGEIDTSFGTNGFVEAGSISTQDNLIADGTFIWSVGNKRVLGNTSTSIKWLRKYDEAGNLILSQEYTVATFDYRHMVMGPGFLLFSMSGYLDVDYHDIRRMSFGLNVIDGYEFPPLISGQNINLVRLIGPSRNNLDCNPAYIINNLATNTRYGARMSAGYICDECYLAAENYWGSRGILISVKINESKPWLDWVDYILAHCGGSRNFDGGKMHIRPFKDEDSQFTLTDDDIVQTSPDEPGPKVQVTKRPYSETYNRIEVVWTDRNNNYDTAVAVAQDEVDQRISGQIRKKTVNLAGIHNAELAAYMAQRLLIDSMYRFDIFKFTVTYANMLIELGDVGTLTCDDITARKIRVMGKDESEHGRDIVITAIEEYSHFYPDPFIIHYATQANQRVLPDPITFEDSTISFLEDITEHKLYLSVVPGSANVNGWLIYRSYDDATYELLGRCGISGVTGGDANSAGTIGNYIPGHPAVTWSPTESSLVDIGTVTDLHTDISEEQFWNDRRLAVIGDEIISFRDAEETATAGVWEISCLRRGLFGTEPVAHYSGESFATLDKNFTWKFSQSDIGKTVYFKAVPFYGDIIADISAMTSFSVVIGGYAERPAAAGLLRLTADENDGGGYQYSGASFTLFWNLGSRVSGFNYGDWLNLPWNNYIADSELQAIVLKFEQEDGTAITEREIAVGSSTTITKATDLGGYDRAVIKVVPRRTMESRLENSILVEDGS